MSVFLYAEGRSTLVPKQVLLKSRYFSSLIKNELYSDIKITAPDWMPYRSLETYLLYLKTDSIPSLDTLSLQKLLWISDYFEDLSLQQQLIEQVIPQLTRDSALLFLQDATIKLNSKKFIKPWEALQKACKEAVTKNLRYIFVNHSELFDKLDKKIAEEIIEESLCLKYFTAVDHSPLLERVKNLYQVEGTCEMIGKIEGRIQEKNLNEVFNWTSRVKNLEADIAESQVFYINNTKWQLGLSCKKNLVTLSVSFKSETFSENSVLAVYIQVIFNEEADYKTSPKLLLLPLGMIRSADIREVLLLSNPFSFKIKARVEYLYSALIQELLLRPESLLNEEVSNFPFECLEFVLGLKQLSVRHEDQVLEIIARWVETQEMRPNEREVEDLLTCVRWDFITVKALVSSVSAYVGLKDYHCFKKAFREELEVKMNSKHARGKPRNSYKASNKESFKGPKDYIETLAHVLLETEVNHFERRNDEALNEMDFSITQQENEIKVLKNRYCSLRDSQETSVTPAFNKLGASADGFYRVPGRIRKYSNQGRQVNISPLSVKGNRTGALLGTLLRKLNVKGSS
jgi:hypothetical protein